MTLLSKTTRIKAEARNGPKGTGVFLLIFFKQSSGKSRTVPLQLPMKIAATVFSQPNKAPARPSI